MKCRAQQQGFCLLQKNQITEVEINMLSVGPISRPREIFYLHFFTFNFLLLSLARKLPFGREGRARQRVRAGRVAGTGHRHGGPQQHLDAHRHHHHRSFTRGLGEVRLFPPKQAATLVGLLGILCFFLLKSATRGGRN